MSAIGPISGPSAFGIGMPSSSAPTASPASSEQSEFGKALRDSINRADQDQQKVTSAVGDLLTGASQDVLPAVTAAAQADISFKLLIGVRNKVIEAYKQTLNMQR
jgi:flagellar hook-basal body complex protein FliE